MTIRDSSGATRSYDRTTTTYFAMVRLVLQKTDMLIHVNVPQTELLRSGDVSAMGNEEKKGQETLEQIMSTLRILNYGLWAQD